MQGHENERVVRDLFAAAKRGQTDTALDFFAEDAVCDVPVPPHVPWAGRRFGRNKVEEAVQVLLDTTGILTFEPQEFVVEGDRVVVIGTASARVRETGREFVTGFVMVFTMRNGLVAGLRNYLDTAQVGGAFDTGQDKLAWQPAMPSLRQR